MNYQLLLKIAYFFYILLWMINPSDLLMCSVDNVLMPKVLNVLSERTKLNVIST